MMKSILIVNANNPKTLLDATLFGADAIMFDLTAVAEEEADTARILVSEAIPFFDFGSTQPLVRITCISCGGGIADIDVIKKSSPFGFVVSNATVENVKSAAAAAGDINLYPCIDTVAGVECVADILAASDKVAGVFFDSAGFLSDLGAPAVGAEQLIYARSKVVIAAKLAGLDAYDTAFPNAKDAAGLKADTQTAKGLGFAGKSAINGNQVSTINAVFA